MAILADAASLSPRSRRTIRDAPVAVAFRHRVVICRVAFHDIECLGDQAVGRCQMLWRYEIEVGGGVILGDLTELAALEEANRKIEPR